MCRIVARWAHVLYFALGIVWCSLAYAQTNATQYGLAYDMARIQFDSWIYATGAAMVGGILKALGDISQPGNTTPGWKLFRQIVYGILMGIGAGLAVFLLLESFPEKYRLGGPLVLLLVALGGYGGKRVLDKMYQRAEQKLDTGELPPGGTP